MPKKTRHYNIFIGGDDIHYVNIFNYLSIKLDEKLDFESHAKECLRPVSHKLYLVSRIRYPSVRSEHSGKVSMSASLLSTRYCVPNLS